MIVLIRAGSATISLEHQWVEGGRGLFSMSREFHLCKSSREEVEVDRRRTRLRMKRARYVTKIVPRPNPFIVVKRYNQNPQRAPLLASQLDVRYNKCTYKFREEFIPYFRSLSLLWSILRPNHGRYGHTITASPCLCTKLRILLEWFARIAAEASERDPSLAIT